MTEIYALYSPYPGAGKTTLAKTIEHYKCAKIISFASPMRYMIKALFQYATYNDFNLFYDWARSGGEIAFGKTSGWTLRRKE